MSNTVTACENVCRDFSWLEFLSPLFLVSIPIVAAWIAYSRQKSRERVSKLQETRAELYRATMKDAFIVFSGLADSADASRKYETKFDNQEVAFRKLQGQYDALATCAREPCLRALDQYVTAIAAYRAHLRVEFGELKYTRKYKDIESIQKAFGKARAARGEAVEAIRKDIFENPFRVQLAKLDDLSGLMQLGSESLEEVESIK